MVGGTKATPADSAAHTHQFSLLFKAELNRLLKILGSPVAWHRRWCISNSAGKHICSAKADMVFYDFDCECRGSESDRATRCRGIARCKIFVAHLNKDCLSEMISLKPSAGCDRVCDFLLEITIATHLFHTQQGEIQALIPLLSQPAEYSESPDSFYGTISELSDEPSDATNTEAISFLSRQDAPRFNFTPPAKHVVQGRIRVRRRLSALRLRHVSHAPGLHRASRQICRVDRDRRRAGRDYRRANRARAPTRARARRLHHLRPARRRGGCGVQGDVTDQGAPPGRLAPARMGVPEPPAKGPRRFICMHEDI